MNTKIRTEDLSFLQLADSFFPTGLYSTSNGLEALYYTKKVKPKDIKKLVELFLQQQVGPSDCTALGNAFEYAKKSDLQGLVYTDQIVYSMKTIEEVRIASVRSGTQLLKCIYSFAKKKKMLESYMQVVNEGNASGTYPVALAVSAWSLGIEKYRAGMMLLYGFTVSMIGAALRLGLVQHFEAQKIIHLLKPRILDSLWENIDRPLSDMWQFAPALDILQMKHEQMLSKMFIT
jgi:urease accessory protein